MSVSRCSGQEAIRHRQGARRRLVEGADLSAATASPAVAGHYSVRPSPPRALFLRCVHSPAGPTARYRHRTQVRGRNMGRRVNAKALRKHWNVPNMANATGLTVAGH